MYSEFEKIEKAKIILEKMAKGIDPLTGEVIGEDSFLNDSRIVRCIYFVVEVLDKVTKGTYRNSKISDFIITPEQKDKVKFPPDKIGVNEFSRCINECLDASVSKKLTGVELNKRLRKLGVLSEETTLDGKKKTIINSNSLQYGLEMEKRRNYNGVEYDAVIINDKGKKYLLDNLESIMATEVTEASV